MDETKTFTFIFLLCMGNLLSLNSFARTLPITRCLVKAEVVSIPSSHIQQTCKEIEEISKIYKQKDQKERRKILESKKYQYIHPPSHPPSFKVKLKILKAQFNSQHGEREEETGYKFVKKTCENLQNYKGKVRAFNFDVERPFVIILDKHYVLAGTTYSATQHMRRDDGCSRCENIKTIKKGDLVTFLYSFSYDDEIIVMGHPPRYGHKKACHLGKQHKP